MTIKEIEIVLAGLRQMLDGYQTNSIEVSSIYCSDPQSLVVQAKKRIDIKEAMNYVRVNYPKEKNWSNTSKVDRVRWLKNHIEKLKEQLRITLHPINQQKV